MDMVLGSLETHYYPFDWSPSKALSDPLKRFLERKRKPPISYYDIDWTACTQQALEARAHAISYRGFRVSCAVYARGGGRPYVFTGANYKPYPNRGTICAECFAINAALRAHCDEILALMVIGEPQIDGESGLHQSVLHPCKKCRKMFLNIPQLTPDTFFKGIAACNEFSLCKGGCPIGPSLSTYELWRLGDLLATHEYGKYQQEVWRHEFY